MTQYQSFPGASGDSRTLDKLKALHLPGMSGRTFLDVGCNEGFFCGYAKHQGAIRSVGVDYSELFVGRARERFPDCEFHARSWDELPDGAFDTILLASALHYADDQEALIHGLVRRLSADGVLVLEMGIVSSTEDDWVRVQRGIDERLFPTTGRVHAMLAGYAWKWMGPSVQQAGDPVKRHVIHIRRRRPIAYLLMEPPGYGKSSIAARLFANGSTRILSGDTLLDQLASGQIAAPHELSALVAAEFTPFTIDKLIASIFRAGLLDQLVSVWCGLAGEADFALDSFVPAEHQAAVQEALRTQGYFPVRLTWGRIGPPPAPEAAMNEQAEDFYFSLSQTGTTGPQCDAVLPEAITGFLDEVGVVEGQLHIRGWAIAPSGFMPAVLAVRRAGTLHILRGYEKQQRPDVQRHFGVSHDLLGFRVVIPLTLTDVATFEPAAVEVMGGDDPDALTSAFPRADAG